MDTYEVGFEEPIEILAVLKRSQYDPDKGQITPVAFVENSSNYSSITNCYDSFPNSGNVWVSSEYTYLTDHFKHGELFKIKAYKDDREDYKSSTTKDKYWTKGSKAIKLDRIKLYPIIEVDELPDSSNPYLSEEIDCEFPFFLTTSEGQMYGPFTLSTDEHGKKRVIALEAMRGAPLGLKPEYVYSVDFVDVEQSGMLENFVVNDENSMYLNNAEGKLQKQGWSQIDYVSDEKLLNWGLRYLFPKKEGVRSSKKEIDKWKTALDNIKTFEGDDEARRVRLLDLVSKVENLDNDWEPLIKKAILDNKKLVEDYIARNEDSLIDKTVSPLREKFELERDKIDASMSVLRGQRETLDKEISELKRQKSELEEKHTRQAKETLEREEIELVEKRKRLNDEIQALLRQYDLVTEYDKLEQNLQRKRKQYQLLDSEISTLKSDDLPRALSKLKTELSVLHGNYGTPQSKCSLEDVHCELRTMEAADRKTYVSEIQDYLEDSYGRSFKYDEIANFLISYQNSFLTVFAGAPGSGKTSTARFLSNALGLDQFFLPVRVARGWASQRDLLGYFNPINSTFQEARTGIYSFLKKVDGKAEASIPLCQILLDEANLSPIEHYWADFLSMCDCKSGKFRKIDVGSNDSTENVTVEDSVRFVATINNDNTTEKLSPRLVDRATIIRLPEIDISEASYIDPDVDPLLPQAVSYDTFKNMFCAIAISKQSPTGEQVDLSELEFDKLKRISAILSEGESVGQKIILSPRKINSIKSYCYVARKVFEEPNNALDFAVLQQVLPVIEGFGENFGDKLKRLLDEVTRLPRTKLKLQEILNRGQAAHHSYTYFA